MEFKIDGEFKITFCDKKLRKMFPDYMYMNCLFKRRTNERILQLYFEKKVTDPKEILKIHRLISKCGKIKKKVLEHVQMK